jgi:molybdate transport system substrate-binding protein
MKLWLPVFFFFLLPAFATAALPLRLAVAPNFLGTLGPVLAAFTNANPGPVEVISASSGKLTAQILAGADFDVFLSADTEFPDQVFTKGFAFTNPEPYAVGTLVLFSRRGIDLKAGIFSITNAAVKKFAIANPALAPYGRSSMEALSNAGLLCMTDKMILSENINQTLVAALTSVEAAFVGRSLLNGAAVSNWNVERKYFVPVDPSLYQPIRQSLVILKESKNPIRARAFRDFLLSPAGRGVIAKNGYSLP